MTSSLIRARPRRATSHISVRVAHTLLGGLAGVVWLVLPGMTINDGAAVAGVRAEVVEQVQAQEEDDSSAADLILPLLAVGAAGVVAGYAYRRRTRRARTRTTPGGGTLVPPWTPSTGELDEQARALLVTADDCVRTSREELGFAEARFGETAVEPFARAVRDAEAELAAAFRMRQQYDHGVPAEPAARQHALAGIVGRCEEAGRRLDTEAAGFDQLRALERGVGEALEIAEGRFRALTGRTAAVEARFAELHQRYAPTATAPVTGYTEQAKDRLVLATFRLNQARQSADLQKTDSAALHLRTAEAAVDQAAVLLDGVDRLAGELETAARLVPATLTGAESEISEVRGILPAAGEGGQPADAGAGAMAGAIPDDTGTPAQRPAPSGVPDVPVGELRSRVLHADAVLAALRQTLTGDQPYDPLHVLRRIVEALTPVATGLAGVLGAAAALVARSTVSATDDFVATHRGAVGAVARTRLAEAERVLTEDPTAADTYARQARDLAEQDVRVHGNPAAEHESGAAGAALGGIMLNAETPASFGGPHSRKRRAQP